MSLLPCFVLSASCDLEVRAARLGMRSCTAHCREITAGGGIFLHALRELSTNQFQSQTLGALRPPPPEHLGRGVNDSWG